MFCVKKDLPHARRSRSPSQLQIVSGTQCAKPAPDSEGLPSGADLGRLK